MKYFKFLFAINKKSFLVIVLISLIISTLLEYIFVASVPYLLNIVFNNEVVFNNFFILVSNKQDLLKYVLVIILIVFFLKSIFYFINQYLYFKYSFEMQNKLSQLLLSKYLNQNYSIFINSQSSEMLRNVKDNTELVRGLLQNCLTFFSEILVFLGLSAFIIYKSTLISLFSIIFIIFFSLLYVYFSRKLSKNWSLKRQQLESDKIQYLQESFSGFKELKLFNKQDFFIKNYNEKNTESNLMNFRFNLLYSFPKVYLEIIGALGVVVLIILNLDKGDKNSFINAVPLLGLYFVAFVRILPSVNRILNSIETHRFGFPALRITYNILKRSVPAKVLFNNKNINFNKDIVFKNVGFDFQNKKKIFKDINFKINFGDKIGIIGESGIGKTTLVNLISGLLIPNHGLILSDNQNIHKNINSFQSNIGFIYQSTFLMNDTLENNISFNAKKDDDHNKRIKNAIKLTNLNSVIRKLPKGLETLVGDKGTKISGGQIQRIGIARALYFNRKILICDEVTNSLDSISEKYIINCLSNLDKTIIMISHKRSNLNFCSKIYEIKNNQLLLIKK
jgi:ABC-type bacteriocin/lantibiotic exporter with double-glycine peptidase domain